MDEKSAKNQQWKKTSRQLKQAFEAWDALNSRSPELSADEKQLKEIKNLLKDIKGQMESLAEPSRSGDVTAPSSPPSSLFGPKKPKPRS